MEILLIGNGFDLEHNLPTSYPDFLKFCEKARRIYTYDEKVSVDVYQKENLEGWIIDSSIRDALFHAFKDRDVCTTTKDDGSFSISVSTPNKYLDELYPLISQNTWLEYFLNCPSYIGDDWIDFESEISRVIRALDAGRFQVSCDGNITNVEHGYGVLLTAIWKAAKTSLKNTYKDIAAIDEFTSHLDSELNSLIRALEIYISGFVHNIPVPRKSPDIEKLNPDHILSFNYSDTYERIYGLDKDISYDFIHGKADIEHNIRNCNMVLGIDEYLEDSCKNDELQFIAFKKYYQRIYKATGNKYLNWIDIIERGYDEYVRKIGLVHTGQPDSLNGIPWQRRLHISTAGIDYPKHTLYIFGHSLDVTDGDVLRKLICNENVQTKIFYYRKYEDDKRTLGKMIKNLVRIIGQDELIRRTGGAHKTIEFIPQTLHEK